ncbi:MAG: glycosyltransferase family 4 protein [Candidatus Omnitrophica bacterium]|nr:glycosyltransferase family 4 protein [Candidatus Omnitrophota bacterium]
MARFKVLHVHTLPIVSGSGINTLLTMTGLRKYGYEVEFACAPGGPLVDEAVNNGIEFRPVRNFVQRVNMYNDLMTLWELAYIMKRKRYDIVHTHNSKAGFIGRLAARIAGVPIIVHTIHGFSFHEYEKPLYRKLFIWLERFAARFADRLIVISEPLKEWGLALKIGKPSQYVTIYSGIEIEKFQIRIDIEQKRHLFGIKSSDLVIGVVSKLWEGKGHKCILQAARPVIAKIPNVKFMFVGEGYLRKELESLTRQLGLNGHVIFTGFRNDIPEVTAIFDIAILASFFEGLGRVLLEAMIYSKPVIATKVGGIVDVVDDGVTGLLIPPGDSTALSEAMVKLLSDRGLRERMGRAGREKIDNKFGAQTMVCQIREVYEELLLKKSATLKK